MKITKKLLKEGFNWLAKLNRTDIPVDLALIKKKGFEHWTELKNLSEKEQIYLISFITSTNGIWAIKDLELNINKCHPKKKRVLKEIKSLLNDQEVDQSKFSNESKNILNGDSPFYKK
jgi:hypothetical protein